MTKTKEPYQFEHDRKLTTTNLNGEYDRKLKTLFILSGLQYCFIKSRLLRLSCKYLPGIYAVCDSCITSGITLLILFAKLLVISFTSQFVRVIGLKLFRCSVLLPFFSSNIIVDSCCSLLSSFFSLL